MVSSSLLRTRGNCQQTSLLQCTFLSATLSLVKQFLNGVNSLWQVHGNRISSPLLGAIESELLQPFGFHVGIRLNFMPVAIVFVAVSPFHYNSQYCFDEPLCSLVPTSRRRDATVALIHHHRRRRWNNCTCRECNPKLFSGMQFDAIPFQMAHSHWVRCFNWNMDISAAGSRCQSSFGERKSDWWKRIWCDEI